MDAELDADDRKVMAHVKRLLEQSTADLDPATALKLQRARVDTLRAQPRFRWRSAWVTGLALVTLATAAVLLWTERPTSDLHPVSSLEDIDLVLSAENVELADNLEFYHWLADVDTTS